MDELVYGYKAKLGCCYTTNLLRVALKNGGERKSSQWAEVWWIFTYVKRGLK